MHPPEVKPEVPELESVRRESTEPTPISTDLESKPQLRLAIFPWSWKKTYCPDERRLLDAIANCTKRYQNINPTSCFFINSGDKLGGF
jgi:hypothetical protein